MNLIIPTLRGIRKAGDGERGRSVIAFRQGSTVAASLPPLSLSVTSKGRESRKGPGFYKDIVQGTLTAIWYMLGTRCLPVASQESHDGASLLLRRFGPFLNDFS